MFELDTNYISDEEENELDFSDNPSLENNMNPLEVSFDQQKLQMENISDDIWKKIIVPAQSDAKSIDLSRHVIIYHRNFFMENHTVPFDSTHLKSGDPDEFHPDNIQNLLTGLIEAMSSMKEGEKSLFIIGSAKMFGPLGCVPRVLPNADILLELEIVKVKEIGDVNFLKEFDMLSVKSFNEAQKFYEEAKLKAKYFFSKQCYSDAISVYQKILQVLELSSTETKEEKEEKISSSIQIMTNLALCYNKNDQARRALTIISEIEKKCCIDDNAKILYQKAKAYRILEDYKNAAVLFKKAYNLKPNKEIAREMEFLNKTMAVYEQKSKDTAKKMLK